MSPLTRILWLAAAAYTKQFSRLTGNTADSVFNVESLPLRSKGNPRVKKK